MDFDTASALWRYDPETGFLHWRERAGPRRPAGSAVTRRTTGTYIPVIFAGHSFKAHRIAWLLSTGEWPLHEIDHINGNKADNRRSNLRDVPHQVNQLNQKHHRNGTKKADWRSRVGVTFEGAQT